MIRSRSALTRQVQDFFHSHLLGVFSWEEITFDPPERVEFPTNPKERREAQAAHEDKMHERVVLRFGRYDLIVESPSERPPLGLAKLKLGAKVVEGPLDPSTWSIFGNFIRKEEHKDGHRSTGTR